MDMNKIIKALKEILDYLEKYDLTEEESLFLLPFLENEIHIAYEDYRKDFLGKCFGE